MLKRCFLFMLVFILTLCRMGLCISAVSDDICFYLSAESVGDHIKVTLASDGEKGFCGALLSIIYDDTKCRYSHCISVVGAGSTRLTVNNTSCGRIDILIEGTENIPSTGEIAYFYFRSDAEICGFSLAGNKDRTAVAIESGKALYITASLCGAVYRDVECADARFVGIQMGEGRIRAVGVSDGKYLTGFDVYRICPYRGTVEHMTLMVDMHFGLAYTKCRSADISGEVFFALSIDMGKDLTCLIIRPFEVRQGTNIYGEERVLLFYNGGYYG